jgi:predicted aspartyl protease
MKYPFRPAATLIVVQAEVVGPHGTALVDLALDTGASTTILSWTTAVAAGYDPGTVTPRRRVITGSGEEFCPLLTMQRLRALGRSVDGLEILCHDLPAQSAVRGLLGLNFLSLFDVRINFKQGFITLR